MTKQTIALFTLCFVIAATNMAVAAEPTTAQVDYPTGYRQWVHVKSTVIQEGNEAYDVAGGIHHIYANEAAFQALTEGKPYADGAVFVFDLLMAETRDHAINEGPRKLLGVMQKDSKKFKDTGGWGFAVFQDDVKDRVPIDSMGCFKCHEPQKDSGYVYSKFRK